MVLVQILAAAVLGQMLKWLLQAGCMVGFGCAAVVAAAAAVHSGDVGFAGFHQVAQNLDVFQNDSDHLNAAAHYDSEEAAAVI